MKEPCDLTLYEAFDGEEINLLLGLVKDKITELKSKEQSYSDKDVRLALAYKRERMKCLCDDMCYIWSEMLYDADGSWNGIRNKRVFVENES